MAVDTCDFAGTSRRRIQKEVRQRWMTLQAFLLGYAWALYTVCPMTGHTIGRLLLRVRQHQFAVVAAGVFLQFLRMASAAECNYALRRHRPIGARRRRMLCVLAVATATLQPLSEMRVRFEIRRLGGMARCALIGAFLRS